MKMRVLASLALAFGLMCGCSDPGSGTNSSTGSNAGTQGDGGSASNASGSSSGTGGTTSSTGTDGTTATNGTSATNGTDGSTATNGTNAGTSGSSGTVDPVCNSGRQACNYDNECGGSRTCLNQCCIDTADNCQNGSAAYGECAPGWVADVGPGSGNTDCCILADGGTGGGGSTGGTTGSSSACDFDGGYVGGSCNPECDHGFHCQGSRCVLNGGNGDVQVTLRWNQPRDMDLHVIEPGGCEVYYGNRTCVGSLDLDSNAGCGIDNVDIENVIYDPTNGPPPPGTYTVRAADWSDCSQSGPIPYQVIIRHGGVTDTYCGSFPANSGAGGGAGTGQTVATFTYP